MSSSRPSPSKHASELNVGIVLPGNNGNYWIVKERENKTHYWKDTKISTSKYKTKKTNINSHEIIVTEPITLGTSGFGIKLFVSDKFLDILRKKPKLVESEHGNGYIFGPMKTGYIYVGSHGNDIAQTGIILADKNVLNSASDINKLSNEEEKKIIDLHLKNIKKSWHYPPILKLIHSLGYTQILFIGETYGGDVGADVFVHLDDKGSIDGLVIDNFAVFDGSGEVRAYKDGIYDLKKYMADNKKKNKKAMNKK